MIVQLTYASYDVEDNLYFVSPPEASEADFRLLCDRLLCRAAEDWLAGTCRCPYHRPREEPADVHALVAEVAVRLHDHGYRRVAFPRAVYRHAVGPRGITDPRTLAVLGELGPRLAEHNAALEREEEAPPGGEAGGEA